MYHEDKILVDGRFCPRYMIKYIAVAVAVTVSGVVAVPVAVPMAVPVAGLTKRFFNHIQKDFLINVWGYFSNPIMALQSMVGLGLW